MKSPEKGTLLIANPFLKDPNFLRTVVLLCSTDEEGAVGFVLSKKLPLSLHDIVPEFPDVNIPVFIGGPVQQDSLYFIHQFPDIIEGGEEVIDGIYWGGNYESLKIHLTNQDLDLEKIKFFAGYSGWSAGQLDGEMSEDSWITTTANQLLVFKSTPDEIWKDALKQIGGPYDQMINYPLDPQLN